MQTNIINFAHANGFPAGSYKTLFDYFPDHFKIIALDKYGHNEQKPINHNWQAQVDELINFLSYLDKLRFGRLF